MKIEHELLHYVISSYYISIIPNFYLGYFECDLFSINKKFMTTEYEIKTNKADYISDFNKDNNPRKHEYLYSLDSYRHKHTLIKTGQRTNKFYFVLDESIDDIKLPDYAGLITFKTNGKFIHFERIKRAPRLHKNMAGLETMSQCLRKLTWRYYATTRNNKVF